WLKKTYKFVGKRKEEIEKIKFIPFWLTLFSWRRNDLSRHSQKSQKSQKNTTQTLLLTSQIVNSLLFLNILNFIPKLIIREIWAFVIEYLSPEVPERSYALRILDYFHTPTQISTISSPYMLFYCYLYAGFLYQNMDYVYHAFKVFAAILLWIIHRSHSSNYHMNMRSYSHPHQNSSYNIIIIHMTFYLYSLLTTTPQLFNKPFLSQNPKDLWSKRWHQIYRSSFTELGYFPIINFFEKFNNSSLRVTLLDYINSAGKLLRRLGSLLGCKTFLRNKKIQKDIQSITEIINQNDELLKNDQIFKNNVSTFTIIYSEISRALAVIGSFLWSAILHEYLFIGLFGWSNSR
ncbi:3587_t:CDS:1, partial [Dentiscutata erythropus]